MSDIEQRLSQLEEINELRLKRSDGEIRRVFRQRAEQAALSSLVAQLAEHAGVPRDHFQKVLREGTLFFLDRFLRSSEKLGSEEAVRFDDRKQKEMTDTEEMPRLFP